MARLIGCPGPATIANCRRCELATERCQSRRPRIAAVTSGALSRCFGASFTTAVSAEPTRPQITRSQAECRRDRMLTVCHWWDDQAMNARPLTQRERAVLDALLTVDFPDVATLRHQATEVAVVGTCGCGCPSIDFQHGRGLGM